MKYEESSTVELKSEVNADFKKEVIALANTDGTNREYDSCHCFAGSKAALSSCG